MSKRIVYTAIGGNVCVVLPAYNDPITGRRGDETEASYLSRVQDIAVPDDATNICICEETELPTSRLFRNAWSQSTASSPEVAMVSARAIKTDLIRLERNKRLVDEDIKYMQADEGGNATEKIAIAARKQTLRDIPRAIQTDLDAITLPEDLEIWEPSWPDEPQ